jgi:hypothetical protein
MKNGFHGGHSELGNFPLDTYAIILEPARVGTFGKNQSLLLADLGRSGSARPTSSLAQPGLLGDCYAFG